MGNTRDTGYLRNLVAYDASGNIVLPANLTVTGSIVGYATTSYVTTQINNLINGAPGLLDTLDELAAALGDDANFASTITTSIAGKLSLTGGTLTGALNGNSASFSGNVSLNLPSIGGTRELQFSYFNATNAKTIIRATGTSDFRQHLDILMNTAQSDSAPTQVVRIANSGAATFSSTVYANGNLATANGNQGANATSATLFLGNRGYFSSPDVGAATIRAISTGTFWYSGTALSFSTNPGPDVTGTNAVERMLITSGGYLKLHQSRFLGDSDICYIDLYNPNLGNLRIVNTSSSSEYGNIVLSTNNTERVRIAVGGNVGIGTVNPATQLNVGHENHGLGFAYIGSSALPSIAGLFTDTGANGGQGYGSLQIKSRSDYAGYSINFFTAASNNVPVQRMQITSGGLVRITSFTSNGLVGTDAAGNLGVVNNTYTEIPTGTISYSMASVAPWAINNSFPSTIRNYTDEAMIGTGSLDFNSNINRGISFDLGSAKAVRKIVERGYSTMNLDSITVQYSTDNSNWTDIHVYRHVYGNTQKDMEFNPTGAIAARYWRWLISGWTARETQNYYTYEVILYT
jgi:hypothetical protein